MSRRFTHPPDFWIGVDLGQKQNHTAVAVVERSRYVTDERDPATWAFRSFTDFVVRDVWRLPLGTEYPDVVLAVQRVASSFQHRRLIIDATGVGAPVVDLLRRTRLGCHLDEVTVTAGGRASHDGHGRWSVPKRDLLIALLLLLEKGDLRISTAAREHNALIDELANFQCRFSPDGNDSYSAAPGHQDDLVLALSLACWRLTKRI